MVLWCGICGSMVRAHSSHLQKRLTTAAREFGGGCLKRLERANVTGMPLAMEVEELNAHSAVVTLTGSLILGSNLRTLEDKVSDLIERGHARLLLDLTRVTYLDSSGLGLVVRTHARAQEKQGFVRLCGVSPKIAELLALTTTDTFLVVDRDRKASLSALLGSLRHN